MNQTRKIRWLIAHEPVNLFLRTAEAFKEKLSELTSGKFEVEIYTVKEYETKFPATAIRDSTMSFKGDPMSLLDSESIELSQLHITELARWHSPEFLALEMPFIFDSHEHAKRVLEGPIGKKMLSGLVDTSPARGMAFTYSGGFRCIASNREINKLDDLVGVEFATTYNPVTIDTIDAIGAIPKVFDLRDLYVNYKENEREGVSADALETTIPRYLAQSQQKVKQYLINTKHNLFLTSIIIGNKFWNTLTDDEQAKFAEACEYASQLERKWSVEEAEEFATKENHSDIGVTYVELSESDIERFKIAVKPLFDKYRNFFYPGLIDGIIKS